MFKSTAHNKEGLEEAINTVLKEMSSVGADSPQYEKLVEQLDKLYKIRDTQLPDRVSMDTLAAVLGNLAGLVLVLKHEQVAIITSKAFGMIGRIRL